MIEATFSRDPYAEFYPIKRGNLSRTKPEVSWERDECATANEYGNKEKENAHFESWERDKCATAKEYGNKEKENARFESWERDKCATAKEYGNMEMLSSAKEYGNREKENARFEFRKRDKSASAREYGNKEMLSSANKDRNREKENARFDRRERDRSASAPKRRKTNTGEFPSSSELESRRSENDSADVYVDGWCRENLDSRRAPSAVWKVHSWRGSSRIIWACEYGYRLSTLVRGQMPLERDGRINRLLGVALLSRKLRRSSMIQICRMLLVL